MNHTRIYDLAGLGIGPFNLGLAALSHGLPGMSTIFFEQREEFDWHKGLLLETATVQVPFYADLVTLADPCNRFSFLSFLKATGRFFHFAIRESHFITRKEYNLYCRWVISQLSNLHFHHRVQLIRFNNPLHCYEILLQDGLSKKEKTIYARRIVIGVGMTATVPEFARKLQSNHLFHSDEYLFQKQGLFDRNKITIIGSGQSAAEIYYDLLQEVDRLPGGLQWFTRSERFFPMEYSKLTLEMTSPDYIDYFYHLPENKKEEILSRQKMLYKGINFDLVSAIYDCMYQKTIEGGDLNVGLYTNCELRDINMSNDGNYLLTFYHREQQKYFRHTSGAVILATSYHAQVPAFLLPISDRIKWNAKGQYDVQKNYAIDVEARNIFVQNAELHTHGFNAPDLGMGVHRNSVIINEILGYEYYKLEKSIAFQTFGIPEQEEGSSDVTLPVMQLKSPSPSAAGACMPDD